MNTVEALEKQIKQLQKQLQSAKKATTSYEGQYVVDRKENLYMKVEKVVIDEDGDTCLIGNSVSLNEDEFYMSKCDEINLDWTWVNIEICTREEYEEAVERFAIELKKFLTKGEDSNE